MKHKMFSDILSAKCKYLAPFSVFKNIFDSSQYLKILSIDLLPTIEDK